MWAKYRQSGFTLVELTIVIVVIAVIAAVVIVGYTNITTGARDSERKAELGDVMIALKRYREDNGGYPRCDATPGPNLTFALQSGTLEGCLGELVPTYLPSLPNDPTDNNGQYQYRYAVGYQKNGATSFTGNNSNNYILGTKLEAVSSPSYSGWGQSGLTLLLGS